MSLGAFIVICLLEFLADGLFLVAMLDGPPTGSLRLNQLHHKYLGSALVIWGLTTGQAWLCWTGLAVGWDDSVQHTIQRETGKPWQSPLHRLYAEVWVRSAVVREVNDWLDEMVAHLSAFLKTLVGLPRRLFEAIR